MARAGVYFSHVKRARDALVADGRHPSIAAVRAALGNTGSKTTIHKYLREIEAEEGGQKASVSDAIHALVTQLADQLQGEAASEVELVRARMAELQGAHEHTQAAWNRSWPMCGKRWREFPGNTRRPSRTWSR